MTSGKNQLNRWFLGIAALILWAFGAVYHDEIGVQLATLFRKPIGRDKFDQIVYVGIFAVFLLFVVALLFRIQKNLVRRKTALTYLTITVASAVVAVKFLLISMIEVVHFAQYAILSTLVFLVCRRYTTTALIIYLMALADEAYQHWFIKTNKFAYYDFNDVWLNQIGMAFGLTTLYALGMERMKGGGQAVKGLLILYGACILAFIVLHATGVIGIWPADDGTFAPMQLMYQHIDTFWSKGWKNNVYHILRPLPGVSLHLVTIMVFGLLDQARQ